MTRKSTWCLVIGQLSLAMFLGICLIIKPQFLHSEGGVSNYGVHKVVIIFYTLAFSLCGVFTIAAGHFMPRTSRFFKLTSQALKILGILLLAVLASTYPYKLDRPLKDLHIIVAAVLFIYELVLAAWLIARLRRDILNRLLFGLQVAGSLLALFSLAKIVNLLLVSQLLTAICFAGLLIRVMNGFTKNTVPIV